MDNLYLTEIPQFSEKLVEDEFLLSPDFSFSQDEGHKDSIDVRTFNLFLLPTFLLNAFAANVVCLLSFGQMGSLGYTVVDLDQKAE